MSAKAIAVVNQKGGVGKTTTAVNICGSLAMKGKRALLVDCDPQGNSSASCGVKTNEGKPTLYDVFLAKCTACEAIQHLSYEVAGEQVFIDVLPSNDDLAAVEAEGHSYDVLQQALADVVDAYDFIVLDLPPSLGSLTVNGLVAAQGVLVPLKPEVLPLHGAQDLIDTITRIIGDGGADALNPNLRIVGAFVTMYDSRLTLHKEVYAEAREMFRENNIPVMETEIKRCTRFGESPALGVPTVIADRKTPAVQDYHRLVEEALGV